MKVMIKISFHLKELPREHNPVSQPRGLGLGWEVGGRFMREETYVYLWLIVLRQKPTQHCKAIILKLKKKKKQLPRTPHSL